MARLAIILACTILTLGCARAADPSAAQPMIDAEHAHYHVHGPDVDHGHVHDEFPAGGHAHEHEHP